MAICSQQELLGLYHQGGTHGISHVSLDQTSTAHRSSAAKRQLSMASCVIADTISTSGLLLAPRTAAPFPQGPPTKPCLHPLHDKPTVVPLLIVGPLVIGKPHMHDPTPKIERLLCIHQQGGQ